MAAPVGHGVAFSGPWLQLGGSLAAVLALGLYVHWLWDRRPRPALDRDAALAIFDAEHPEDRADDALVTADGRAALVRLAASDRLGLVAAFGARWRTRVVGARDVAALDASAGVVRLALREIAQPPLVFRFADQSDAQPWLAALQDRPR